ncbi:MAG: endopeptidase La [Saprospiraceae bacterium]|nr:endopeptidase La [Saprospiraceae bacterium]
MFKNLIIPRKLDDASDAEIIPFFSVTDDDENDVSQQEIPENLPILALKNTILFPGVVIPITVGRTRSVKAVKKAFETNKLIAVFSQKDLNNEDPKKDDLYTIGTVARILKLLKMPDGSTTAILQGRHRSELIDLYQEDPHLEGHIRRIPMKTHEDVEFKATVSSIKDIAKNIIELSPQIPGEAVMMLHNIKSDGFLLNFIASNLNTGMAEKQQLLEISDMAEKAEAILKQVDSELQMLELKDQIETKVRGDIEQQQRDYFLNQQLKTIQEELGNNPQEEQILELKEKGAKMKWPEYAAKQFEKELNKAQRINPQMAEYSVTLNYLELMLDLPWENYTKDNFDLKSVKKVLDKDHYGLEDVKDRILEHLAVLKLKGDMKAPIILLVGPPGVGKTSLGKSIARALDRKFVRMSLGGLHDESEIRGHRKTYIGAMPGRILQSVKKAQSSNPVFILDEIDKVGKDFRGDPSSALLEVLDPEQNSTFYDNYLELDYDLSKVLFIATANSLNTIQSALLDRMEIIEISGYSQEEKIEIAKRHLVPKQVKAHGLKASDVRLNKKILAKIISEHTRESGVRNLDREIAGVMRSIARKKAMNEEYQVSVSEQDITDILGPYKFPPDRFAKTETPGVAIGLAWTRVGGDILFIETSLSKGKGKLTLTGNLGDVMKESATTALSYIKANASKLGIREEQLAETDIHIHVPQGAIPKDGPSAGITMMTALVSAFSGKKIKSRVAMSGEITLRGKVLPVGGIKEKVLAAKRSGMKEIILCRENEKDVLKINKAYIKDLNFTFVDRMEEVLEHTLGLASTF